MKRLLVVLVLLSACGSSAVQTKAAPVTSNTQADGTDPYEIWLRNRPADAPNLSREDAQIRALLGCQMAERPAPGTVDAILQAAYGCANG